MLEQPALFEEDTRLATFGLLFDSIRPGTSNLEPLNRDDVEEMIDKVIYFERKSDLPADFLLHFLKLAQLTDEYNENFLEQLFRRYKICEGSSSFVKSLFLFSAKTQSLEYLNLLSRYLGFHKLPKIGGTNKRLGTKAKTLISFEEFAEFRRLSNSANTAVSAAAKQIVKDYFQIQNGE